MAAVNRILILFAHPDYAHSQVNQTMLAAVRDLDEIHIVDLYARYPDFDIDVPAEQKICEQHDIIVFQHPFLWYNCPPILKEWMDRVLTHGWAYGLTGRALTGKKLLSAISTAGPAEAYDHAGRHRFPMRELLAPFDQTAFLCGMEYLPPFVFHGAHRADHRDITNHGESYRALLLGLRDGGEFDNNSRPLDGD